MVMRCGRGVRQCRQGYRERRSHARRHPNARQKLTARGRRNTSCERGALPDSAAPRPALSAWRGGGGLWAAVVGGTCRWRGNDTRRGGAIFAPRPALSCGDTLPLPNPACPCRGEPPTKGDHADTNARCGRRWRSGAGARALGRTRGNRPSERGIQPADASIRAALAAGASARPTGLTQEVAEAGGNRARVLLK